MAQPILERDHERAELANAAREAADGAGSVALVFGEPGVGKSSLVRAACSELPEHIRALVGYCDDMATPRTLGPFRDLVGGIGAELTRALEAGDDRAAVMAALRSELDRPGRPTVLVVEDVHWADDATLDALQYLIRRVDRLPVALVLTYRDDEVEPDHPLRRLLGQAAGSQRLRRLPMSRLSEAAVRQLTATSPLDAAQVYTLTAGNPFFVTEVLAANDTVTVPATVADTVLARIQGLDEATRSTVEQLSVVPSLLDSWLIEVLVPGGVPALAEPERRGLLTVSPDRSAFRHELIRRTVADSLTAARRVHLNRRVLAALLARPGADLSRIVHHAAAAGDEETIAQYGPEAAREAARAGSHREAAAHLRLVLAQRSRFTSDKLADLLSRYAVECYTIGDTGLAVPTQREAVDIRRSLGDPRFLGADLRWLSRMHWLAGDIPNARSTAREAIAVLEGAGDDRLLALALSNQSQLHMLANEAPQSIEVGDRAIALARKVDDAAILSHALDNVGCARWQQGDPGGRSLIEESIAVALDAGEMEEACRAYANLGGKLLEETQLDDAGRAIGAGLAIAEEVEQLFFLRYMSVLLAMVRLARAAWDDTVSAARLAVDAQPGPSCLALTVLGKVRIRRGQPGGDELLSLAWERAVSLGDPQWKGPVAAARAEAAWLRGEPHVIPSLVEAVYADAVRLDVHALRAELSYWLGRSGRVVDPIASTHPYAVQAAGRWRDAAEAWRAAGYPYEHAAALAESPDPDDLLVAVAALDALGARPLARMIRARLRDVGVARIPRGPAGSTRRNPHGLTERQWEVAQLLAGDLTNAEIAGQLVVSVRTVENHVAAVLHKLGARSRRDAAALVADLRVGTTDHDRKR